jgi:hypothetical protein
VPGAYDSIKNDMLKHPDTPAMKEQTQISRMQVKENLIYK